MSYQIVDYGDTYDSVKWNFDESDMTVFYADNDYYPYKSTTRKKANKLSYLRHNIRELCDNIERNTDIIKKSTHNIEYLHGIDLFLNIHKEYEYTNFMSLPEPFRTFASNNLPTSRYLLSEIPKGTGFQGLNKPKLRHSRSDYVEIGKDGKGRAVYRDIFLDLDISDNKLKKLIIHELAHTGANHINFFPDNHHADFQFFEKLITKYWPE